MKREDRCLTADRPAAGEVQQPAAVLLVLPEQPGLGHPGLGLLQQQQAKKQEETKNEEEEEKQDEKDQDGEEQQEQHSAA
eukprot:SAG22_NODE_301_length_12744_cov_19.648189_13_plen_80_part_00